MSRNDGVKPWKGHQNFSKPLDREKKSYNASERAQKVTQMTTEKTDSDQSRN